METKPRISQEEFNARALAEKVGGAGQELATDQIRRFIESESWQDIMSGNKVVNAKSLIELCDRIDGKNQA